MIRRKLDYKWVVLMLVSIAYFLAQGTRFIYSAVLPQIKADFAASGVTDAQLGLISSAFTLVFGIAIPFAGFVADFFNRKRVLVLGSFMFAMSCTQQPTFETRVEKILYEINDPESAYIVVASHRGDWRNYPENSIPAIESVIRMGVDIMELDVKMTKDSVLILMHDKTIDRMTNGKGRVCDITYDSLMTFNMRRAHNIVTDTLKVPTLREALLCCKDRILVNVDHAYPYYEQIVKLTEELGVAGQVLMKSKSSIDKVNEDTQKYGSRMLYMPVVDVNKPKGKKLFAEYLEKGVVPMAFELCWQYPGEEIDECMKLVHQMGSKIWVNTIWASLCGGLGNDDDAALAAKNPADVYGQYIDMGVSMIQTDRPEMLLNYLRSIGRHD